MAHDHAVKNIKIAFFLNLSFTIIEIIGGLLVNSVSILSDAVHDLGDTVSLGFALFLQKKSRSDADHTYSYGYIRFSLLGALINSVILLAGSVYIISEAVQRINHPEAINEWGMLWMAVLGIAVNGFAAFRLHKGQSLNEKVAFLHLLEDVLGWFAVFIAAVILQFADIPWLDPVLSLVITVFILWNVVKRLRQTLHIFLQGSPTGINLPQIRQKLMDIEGVQDIHHMHSWSLDGEQHVFTAHVLLENINNLEKLDEMKWKLKQVLDHYPFSHCTLETEWEGQLCSMDKSTKPDHS